GTRAHDEIERKIVFDLRIGHVPNRATDSIIEQIFFYISYDTDHRHPWKGLTSPNASHSFADRIFSWPGLASEFLTEHNNGQTFGAVILVKQSSLDQGNPQGF